MENPELYSSSNGMQKNDAKEIINEFRDKLKWSTGCRILDIGCGSGEVTVEIILPQLPKDFSELVGLDISLEMIQHARNLHSHSKVSFIQFDIAQTSDNILEDLRRTIVMSKNDSNLCLRDVECKIESERQNIQILLNNRKILDCQGIVLQKKKNSGYDIISSFYCLHWIANHRTAVKNIYTLLKPGGEALLVFLVKSPIFTLYRKLSTLKRWKDFMKDVDNFIPFYQNLDDPLQSFTEILETTGFKILTSDCRDRNYVFDSFFSLRKAIIAVNPFLTRIPKDLQEDFIAECLYQTETLKLAEFKNNSYRVSYKLIVAHLRKPCEP